MYVWVFMCARVFLCVCVLVYAGVFVYNLFDLGLHISRNLAARRRHWRALCVYVGICICVYVYMHMQRCMCCVYG